MYIFSRAKQLHHDSDRPEADDAGTTPVMSPSPSVNLSTRETLQTANPALANLSRKQRKAVKALAIAVDATVNEYKHQTNFDLIFDKGHYKTQLQRKQADLDKMLKQGLPETVPASGAVRSFKSGVVVAAGATSRVGAVMASGVTGTVHATGRTLWNISMMAVDLPLTVLRFGATGAFAGGVCGSMAPKILMPVTLPAGLAIGAAIGAAVGATQPIVNLPVRLMHSVDWVSRRGSPARAVYGKVDRLPVALAHARRKTQSAAQIAIASKKTLSEVIAGMDAKDETKRSFLARVPFMDLTVDRDDSSGFTEYIRVHKDSNGTLINRVVR